MNNPSEFRLYNTLTRTVETLQPLTPPEIGVYCCGPTVYNFQHIGNLRTYIFEDTLTRALRYAGYKVKHVMNITDVGHLTSDADEGEDKMLLATRRERKTSEEIANYYTDIFFNHCKLLHIQKPEIVCKATDHIKDMIKLIERLEEKGFAYRNGGNIYFDIAKLKDYGKLARLDLDKLQAGARIEIDNMKRNPQDFALWFTQSKFENQELQWDSPWGKGYPGWHIECSAMSMRYLGASFDIHCGGIDHIPVHHTNEIAQSEAASGKPFARFWLHGGFLVMNKHKMSKSGGEFLTLDKVIEQGYDPLSYRLFCYSANYRGELSWSWDALKSADRTLKKLKNTLNNLRSEDRSDNIKNSTNLLESYRTRFKEAVCNDLNMPQALAVMHKVLDEKQLTAHSKIILIEEFDQVFALGVNTWKSEELQIPEEIISLANARKHSREQKEWKKADQIRQQIQDAGFDIEDTKDGYKIIKSQ